MYKLFQNLIPSFLTPQLMLCFAGDAGGGGNGENDDDNPDAGRRSMSEIMAEKFPVEDKPADKPEDKPADKPEDKPADRPEDKPEDKPTNLPPGFKPAGSEKPSDKPEDNPEDKPEDEVDIKELDSAIEKETNSDKKVNLTKFRTKLTRQEEELTTVRSVLDSLRENGLIDDQNKVIAKGADPEIEQKLTEAYDTIGRLSLAHDPRFQKKYQLPINNAIGEVARAINESPANDQEKQQAFQMAQSIAMMSRADRAAAITEHVPEALQMDVALALREHDKMVSERDRAIGDHQKVQQQLEQEHTIAEQQRVDQYRNAIKSDVTAEIEREGFLSRKPGNKEYNDFIDSIYSDVDEVFQSNDPKVQAKAMTLGVMAPVYRGMLEATQAKLQETLTELEQYKKGTVRIAGKGTETGDLPPGTDLSTNEGIAKHIAAQSKAHYK